jgi:hypothetical protein
MKEKPYIRFSADRRGRTIEVFLSGLYDLNPAGELYLRLLWDFGDLPRLEGNAKEVPIPPQILATIEDFSRAVSGAFLLALLRREEAKEEPIYGWGVAWSNDHPKVVWWTPGTCESEKVKLPDDEAEAIERLAEKVVEELYSLSQ